MTQKEIEKFLANTKVYVNGKNKEIQEKLFSFGYKWNSGEKTIQNIDCTFLFIGDNKSIAYNNSMIYFSNSPFEEITAEEILSLKLSKLYRPFKNKEECWNEMYKHEPFGWLLHKKSKAHECLFKDNYTVDSFDTLFNEYEFADNKPFGINEG